MRKLKIVSFGLIALILTLLLMILVANHYSKQLASRPLLLTSSLIYHLPAGTHRQMLQQDLQQRGIMPTTRWFAWLLQTHAELAGFRAGTYRLEPGMTIAQMLKVFARGKEAQFPVRLVEGLKVSDWLTTLRNAPYLQHRLTDDTLATLAKTMNLPEQQVEGHFYPDTYAYTASTTDLELLNRAYQRMQTALNQQWQSRAADLPYQGPEQLLTMASLIEKETSLGEERALIASVFINRLTKGMRLQTDPTVIYGLGDKYTGKLTRQDLLQPDAYNTYIINGLPPGPIAIPSLASLKAAAHPANSQYLFFVANGKGGHTFSRDLREHNTAVKQWRAVEKKQNHRLVKENRVKEQHHPSPVISANTQSTQRDAHRASSLTVKKVKTDER